MGNVEYTFTTRRLHILFQSTFSETFPIKGYLQFSRGFILERPCPVLILVLTSLRRVAFTTVLYIYKERRSWKVYMMTSYLQLMTFLTNGIQALKHWWKKCEKCKKDNKLKNKLDLVTLYEYKLFSQFPPYIYIHIYNIGPLALNVSSWCRGLVWFSFMTYQPL